MTRNKTAFILRDTPAWLVTHQDWISDGARKLYSAMRVLADRKTGRLFVPGRGWIKLRTIEQKAGMCKKTRLKYMRELRRLGAIHEHSDYVTRTIYGRKRKVLGVAQITLLPLTQQKPHKHRGSTTGHFGENNETEPQHRVSTTEQSSAKQAKNTLLRSTSSSGEEVLRQVLSYPTSLSGDGDPRSDHKTPAATVGLLLLEEAASSSPPLSPDEILEAWKSLGWDEPPVGIYQKFIHAWATYFHSEQRKYHEWLADAFEDFIQICNEANLKIPPQFYDAIRNIKADEMKIDRSHMRKAPL